MKLLLFGLWLHAIEGLLLMEALLATSKSLPKWSI